MEIILEKMIHIQCYKINAKVTGYTKEDYRVATMMHVNEQGEATAESLAEDLLAKYKTLARVWLERCKEEGYLSEDGGVYQVTSDGKDVIKNGVIEYGPNPNTWKIEYSDDLLIDPRYRILSIEPDYIRDDEIPSSDAPPEYNAIDKYVHSMTGKNIVCSLTSVLDEKIIQSMRIGDITKSIGPSRSKMRIKLQWVFNEQGSELIIVCNPVQQSDADEEVNEEKRQLAKFAEQYMPNNPNPTYKEAQSVFRNLSLKKHSDKNRGEDPDKIMTKMNNLWNPCKKIHGKNRMSKKNKQKQIINENDIRMPPPQEDWFDVLQMMVEEEGYEWSSKHKCIVMESTKMTSEEIKKKKKTLTIVPNIPKYGRFESIKIEVPIHIRHR